MLVVVEDGNEHVEVGEQIAQAYGCLDIDRKIRAVPPGCLAVVQRVRTGGNRVSQGFEQPVQKGLFFAYGQYRDGGPKGDRGLCQFGTFLALAVQGGAKNTGNANAQKGRRSVRAVVDVLLQGEPAAGRKAAVAHQADGVHIQEQRSRAASVGCLGVKDMGLAKAEFKGLNPVRVFVQKIPQVRGRGMGRRDGEKHREGKNVR